VRATPGETTHNFGSTYRVVSVIFYGSIMLAPTTRTCPHFQYPSAGTAPLSSSTLSSGHSLSQPSNTGWTRSDLRYAEKSPKLPIKEPYITHKRALRCPSKRPTHAFAALSGACYTAPISTYPGELPEGENIQCPRQSYAPGMLARTCRPCGVTASEWFYVFEDSPAVLRSANTALIYPQRSRKSPRK
jgi:hypothetical protein